MYCISSVMRPFYFNVMMSLHILLAKPFANSISHVHTHIYIYICVYKCIKYNS